MIDLLDILADMLFDDLFACELAIRFALPKIRRAARWSLRVLVGWTMVDGLEEVCAQARLDRVDADLVLRLEAM